MSARKGSTAWNKGKGRGWIDKRGYRWFSITVNGKRTVQREHRAVMEKHLGRRLDPWELVHHKNGNTADNSLENLELMTFGQHATEHHTGSRKSADSRRSMEAFALMREELRRERELKADLLEALKNIENDDGSIPGTIWAMCIAAIAKAEGR